MMDLESGGATQTSGFNRYTWVYSELCSVGKFMVDHAVSLIAGGKEIFPSNDAAGAGDEIKLTSFRKLSSEASDSCQAIAVEPQERTSGSAHERTHRDVNRAEQEIAVPSEGTTGQASTKGKDEPDARTYEGANGRALLIVYKTGKFNDGLATVVPVNRPSIAWARAKIKNDVQKPSTCSKGKWRAMIPEMAQGLMAREYARSEEDIWIAVVEAWQTIRPGWHKLVPFWRVKAIQETIVRNDSAYQFVKNTLTHRQKLHVSE